MNLDISHQAKDKKPIDGYARIIEAVYMKAPAYIHFLKGPDFIFDFVNEYCHNLIGNIDIKGRKFQDVLPEIKDLGILEVLEKTYHLGCTIALKEKKIIIWKGGTKVEMYFDLTYQPHYDENENIIGVMGFGFDVTDKVKSRKIIEENEALLEQQVMEKTASLLISNTELRQSNEKLDQFAAIASHDLQEPLRKIQTFTILMEQRFKSELPIGAVELIEKIAGASKRMSSLIKDVLNYSRLQNIEKSFKQLDLNNIASNILKDFELLINESNATIRVAKLPVIEALPIQMNQLFYNLFSNALKFISKKETPLLDVSCRKIEGGDYPEFHRDSEIDYYEIKFTDNGIGFDQEFAEQVLQIFQRLNSNDEYPGTGIGLALCKRIIDNHSGHISVKSLEHTGTTIFVILPASQPR